MQHQDWEPVVFKKKTEQTAQNLAGRRAVSQLPSKQVRNLMEDTGDQMALKLFEKDYIQRVIAKRVERKWSQSDLAHQCNVHTQRIQNLERGKEVYDAALKQKLNKILQIS